MSADLERRFGGVARLYGADGAQRLREAHVCIIGIGGVGTWVVEALARTGIGSLTLIDLDMVAESNTNRQLHALDDQYGKAKVDAMAERVRAINPSCCVQCIEDFVTPENVDRMIDTRYSLVIDAIDQVRAKTAIVARCRQLGLPVIVAGAAGGQIDPTQVRAADLSNTTQDPLLAKLRSQLRRDHGFPRDAKKKFGVTAIYSTEPLRYPDKGQACETDRGPAGLNCAGFGSSVCVTSVFGMAAAAQAIARLTRAA